MTADALLEWTRRNQLARYEYTRDPFAASKQACAGYVCILRRRGVISEAQAAAELAEIRRWGR